MPNPRSIVVRPLPTFWALLALAAVGSAGATGFVAYELFSTGLLWIEGAVFGLAGLLITAIGAFHAAGHRIVIDADEIVEERRGRVLSRHRLDDLSHIDPGPAPTLVFSDGRKLRLALVRSSGASCLTVAEAHLAQEIERRRFERQAERVAPARQRAAREKSAASSSPAKRAAPRRAKRTPTRGATTVQLPLNYLTFADACQVCRQPEPIDGATFEHDVSTALQTLADQERKIEVSVPLCRRCAKRWRSWNQALMVAQGVFLVGFVVAALGWANLDWQIPGWAWALMISALILNALLSHRSVERRFSFRGLGVCVERYLGDASGRAVIRFRHACLAEEARRVTLMTQEQALMGV